MSAFTILSLTLTQPTQPGGTGALHLVVGGTGGSQVSVTLNFGGGSTGTALLTPTGPDTAEYYTQGLPIGVYTGAVVCDNGTSLPISFRITALVLTVTPTDESAAGASDGTALLEGSNGTAPATLEVVELSLSSTANPHTFTGLPAGSYTARLTDGTGQQVEQTFVIRTHRVGCLDEYADNYDPAATSSDDSCTYTPRWRSAWQPMGVKVAAVAGQQAAFVEAKLRIGFRPGHPLAASRPLGVPLAVRATVAPDGYATFVLGPYLRPQLGAPDGAGGYRYDLNSPTAFDADLYVGYELRRTDGTLLEHGYALNSAVPDGQLNGLLLTPFSVKLPYWSGFDFISSALATQGAGVKYGVVTSFLADPLDYRSITLPCPLNPLPVRWLAPGGGYGFWVFQGRSVLGDTVGDGQRYREASSGEQRYSDPGEAYQTYKASSGVFKGDALLLGLRTLWRSPQAWVMLGGTWQAISVERGTRDVGRLGVLKNEVSLSFQLAAPEWAQGQ